MSDRLKISRCFSFTATRDWLFRLSFAAAGLRSVTKEIEGGGGKGSTTAMHCWIPKQHNHSKPNLLLLHGFGANAMWQFGDHLRDFTAGFNVFVPDLLFFGLSSTSDPDRSESFQARCLKQLMELHGVKRLTLLGISYGGFVGYSLAAQFPELVDRLVICCSGVCLEEKDLENGLFRVPNLEEATSILLPQTPDKLRELMQLSFVKPLKCVPSFFLTDFINVMCKKFLQEKRELIEAILKDRKILDLPKITQPTLILWGDQDQIFPVELGHRLKRHLGENPEIVVIKNAGHAVNLEKPKEFSKHLKPFLFLERHAPS